MTRATPNESGFQLTLVSVPLWWCVAHQGAIPTGEDRCEYSDQFDSPCDHCQLSYWHWSRRGAL